MIADYLFPHAVLFHVLVVVINVILRPAEDKNVLLVVEDLAEAEDEDYAGA